MFLYWQSDIAESGSGLVWAKALWTIVGGKNFPPFLLFFINNRMKELRVSADESGEFV